MDRSNIYFSNGKINSGKTLDGMQKKTIQHNKGQHSITQSKQTLNGREPEKRIKHCERCTLETEYNTYMNLKILM
jgi:hypothetical protein